MNLRPVHPTEEDLVLDIFKKSPTYFARVDGCEPSLKTVRQAISDGPEKRVESYRKEFFFIEDQGKPIGVVDLHVDHPEPGVAYIGLLLLTENLFDQGLGRKAYSLIQEHLRTTYAIQSLRLGVSDDNDVSQFWQKMGFAPNGRTYSWKGENKTTHVVEFGKVIAEMKEEIR